VDSHVALFKKKNMPKLKYDNMELEEFQKGEQNLLTTTDSVSKIVRFHERNPRIVKKYALFLDEIHCIVQYIFSSTTLSDNRRSVVIDVQWLMRNTEKMIAVDNCTTDMDCGFIKSALSENVPMTFDINEHQISRHQGTTSQ
jgi:hypothetical protein